MAYRKTLDQLFGDPLPAWRYTAQEYGGRVQIDNDLEGESIEVIATTEDETADNERMMEAYLDELSRTLAINGLTAAVIPGARRPKNPASL